MEAQFLNRLATLNHPQRMAIFRLLIRRYPDALAVGEILGALDLKPSTASVYLAALKSADLVRQRRNGTHLFYQANITASQEITESLLKDCCQGRSDLCLPAKNGNLKEKQSVLFLCTGNSARSIMAEALLRDCAAAPFVAASAGTHPRENLDPNTRALLKSKGHETSVLFPKSTAQFLGPNAFEFDYIFTVCDQAANLASAAFPGAPLSGHWGIKDPAISGDSADFSAAYDDLHARITRFAALPFATLTKHQLQSEIDTIARQKGMLTP